MVHLRLNEREPNPNPHINFISALPRGSPQDQEEARQLLRALAAQVRPIMKAHGFVVNQLVEYQYNSVFAGRCWEAGEAIELVLRSKNGSYWSTSWLMGTLCHELAHIEHGNHGPGFQALWDQLRDEVCQLQSKGYYGDGYWSSGNRLMDSASVPGEGIELGDLPEYICGGSQAGTRPTSIQKRRRRETGSSSHSGRQTAKRRKAGSRVTSKYAFVGDGQSLTADSAQSSKGKRAASQRARQERVLAAEKRLNAISKKTGTSSDNEGSESESEIEFVETDAERRQALLTSKGGRDERVQDKSLLWKDFEKKFNFRSSQQGNVAGTSKNQSQNNDVIDLTINTEGNNHPASKSISASGRKKGKEKEGPGPFLQNSSSGSRMRQEKLTSRGLVKDEIEYRKKENLGLLATTKGVDRTLGAAPKPRHGETETMLESDAKDLFSSKMWSCLVCTLQNDPGHLACMACATPRGEDTYKS
ncbi:hypothetical protein AGABI1DRAFT_41369 [Agaricus bisporus var. burnettii JB137-S8]|uniref:WLM domain-containing protein n=1 Tax=Agaricus bisporus var. burnettii (strain JB137-S8 / ATCC MYA-4627 / FGSC 10392) TaxID=597362 RepID=K5X6B3_AGABU|nr:uncharacterized protein AGABI1DRAFT_41369 [Agaricus bisporus var. burnettii JB137-S8]EKM78723.1 hypothetical protein AGABI1DRAFT_41369 [Agaricus bisporus var. burnettii JB137-S8]